MASRTEAVSITTAATSLSDDLAMRTRRYLWTMGIRTVCFVGAIVVGCMESYLTGYLPQNQYLPGLRLAAPALLLAPVWVAAAVWAGMLAVTVATDWILDRQQKKWILSFLKRLNRLKRRTP